LAATPGLYEITLTPLTSSEVVRLAFATSIVALVVVAGFALNGCGGGSSNPSNPSNPTGGTGTAAGNYTITVTATAGTAANAVSHTIKLALTVQSSGSDPRSVGSDRVGVAQFVGVREQSSSFQETHRIELSS
jgi:hypothetical protein